MSGYGAAPPAPGPGPSRFAPAHTPISPANTTSSVNYSAYGYGASSAAGPSSAPGAPGPRERAPAPGRLTKASAVPGGGGSAGGYADPRDPRDGQRRQNSGDMGRAGTGRSSAGGSQVGADGRETSRVHFAALRVFLRTWLQNGERAASGTSWLRLRPAGSR